MKVVTQYHVSGQPNPRVVDSSHGSVEVPYPRYEFTWTDEVAVKYGYADAREAALDYRDRIGVDWTEPPRITTRTVTYTDWEEV